MSESRSYAAWIAGALMVAVIGSEVVVMRQNAQLRQRVKAQSAVEHRVGLLRTKTDRVLYEASMLGHCQPFYTVASNGAPAAQSRRLDVSVYFSLQHDCLACVEELIRQWNAVATAPNRLPVAITGYTQVDDKQDETILTRDLKPLFPVVRVSHLDQTLSATGVAFTPVVFVSDAATGRILLTYTPLATEKGDHSLVDRLQALATPCM